MSDENEKRIAEQITEVAVQVKEVDRSLTTISAFLFMLAVFTLIGGRMECNSDTAATNEGQCHADCNRRTANPEHAAERTRWNSDECWCFNEKTGETTRL